MVERPRLPAAGKGRNLFPHEPQIRALLALGLGAGSTALGILSAEDLLGWATVGIAAMMTVYLALTATHRHCPLYALLGVNADMARHSYYMTLFPEHNPAPVLAFDPEGEALFRNKPAERSLGVVGALQDLMGEATPTPRGVIEQAGTFTETLPVGERTYQLTGRGLARESVLLVYGFDITQVVELEREMISTQEDIIFRLGEIAETRSQEVGHHVQRVALYSRILAEHVGLDTETARTLEMASPLHDVGKIGIPDSVLNKPGPLDAEEWETMKGHARMGYNLLCRSSRPILQAAATVAHEHHERWDGKGYPRGISGTDIHIFGRITAIADVFDALSSERVYKPAWSTEAIEDLLRRERGYHFDPQLVDAMLADWDRFLQIRERYTDAPRGAQ